MTAELPERFGNYALRDFAEIMLPEPVSWWPQTTAWFVLFGLIVVAIFIVCIRVRRRYVLNRYRRVALDRLRDWQRIEPAAATARKIPELLRMVALAAFPRETVVPLTGMAWLQFLDGVCGEPLFAGGDGEMLLSLAYRRSEDLALSDESALRLIDLAERWIRSHRGETLA